MAATASAAGPAARTIVLPISASLQFRRIPHLQNRVARGERLSDGGNSAVGRSPAERNELTKIAEARRNALRASTPRDRPAPFPVQLAARTTPQPAPPRPAPPGS